MGCEICGRYSCTRSFHSIDEQHNFDEIADSVKERTREYILNAVNRVSGEWIGDTDETERYVLKLEDLIEAIEDCSL